MVCACGCVCTGGTPGRVQKPMHNTKNAQQFLDLFASVSVNATMRFFGRRVRPWTVFRRPRGRHPLPACYPQACPKRQPCARRARSCRLVLVAGRCAAGRSQQFSGLFPQVCAAARICNCHHPSRYLPARIRLPQGRAPIILFICASDAGLPGHACQTLYPRPRLLRSHPGLPGSCRSMGLARRPERTAWLPLHACC